MEELIPIQGFEHLYSVGRAGRVFNHRTGRDMVPSRDAYGYKVVNLQKDGRKRQYKVHRLVAQAYLPDFLPSLTVNHVDEDKGNNSVVNLEMMTIRQNRRYSAKLTYVKAENIRHLLKSGVERAVIASLYGVTTSNVAKIATGWNWVKP